MCRFFERELFGMFPDWRSEPVRFLQAGEGVFVVLFRGRHRASRVPTRLDLAEVWELRQGVPASVREFTTWEGALRAVGLDPSTAAELRRAECSGD